MARKKSEISDASKADSAPRTSSSCRGVVVKTGKPCPATATTSGFCWYHDPNVSEAERQAARSRGHRSIAKARLPLKFTAASFGTADSARQILEEVSDQSRAGKLPVSVAKVVIAAVSAAARLGELALAAKVAELEAQMKASGVEWPRRRRS
jgi:hypothetical protein